MSNHIVRVGRAFTRGEYWILNSAVEFAVPLHWLTLENIGEAFNRRGHGLTRSEVARTLAWLLGEGLIEVFKSGSWRRLLSLSVGELDAALDCPPDSAGLDSRHYYRLSARGGACWEAFAAPNWRFFLSTQYSCNSKGMTHCGRIEGADRERVWRYLAAGHYFGNTVTPGSIVWRELRPWRATYWKRLPVGYRVRFRCRATEKWLNPDIIPYSVHELNNNKGWCEWR